MTVFRVLHVDDDPDIREVAEISLGLDPEIVLRSCASGEAALAAAESWAPDVMLLDVMMPVMDGVATLAKLRSNPRTADIPVVFMTARARSRELDLLHSLGAVGVIPKPFDPMMLAALLRGFIEPPSPRLDAMRGKFLKRVESDLAELSGHWRALANGADARSALAGMSRIAHGLAGSGGVFDFDDISDAAAALEEAIVLESSGRGSLSEIGSALLRLGTCAGTKGDRSKPARQVHG
jgi:CheY-like chemotaxis protein